MRTARCGIYAQQLQGDLSERDLINHGTLLAFAGYSTSADLLGNLLANLFAGQAALRSIQPDVFVEECLRISTPVQNVARYASSDLVIGGVSGPRGSLVLLQFGVANRDAGAFDRPDELTPAISPPRSPHLAFGHGPHHCLGATIAREQAMALCEQLVLEWSGSHLRTTPEYAVMGPAAFSTIVPLRLVPDRRDASGGARL